MNVCCVWDSLRWVSGSVCVLAWENLLRVWGSECLLYVSQFGAGLGECFCAVCVSVWVEFKGLLCEVCGSVCVGIGGESLLRFGPIAVGVRE